MKTNDAGIELIKRFEGVSLKPYVCPAGKYTIGYGHTAGVNKETPPITMGQAEELLRRDLCAAEEVVSQWVSAPLNENQYSALVSFVFNIGPGRKGYKDGFVWLGSGRHSTMLTLLNDGRMEAASQEFPKWANAYNPKAGKREPLAGLVRRRMAERALFLKPVTAGEA